MFYLQHTPWWLRQLFPAGLTWSGPVNLGSEVYLTFDDGPHPQATSFVLNQLAAFSMKATFFCIGKNVVEQPDLFQRILAEGHSVGNHTMHHLNGKKTNTEDYLNDVQLAASHIKSYLFRPPYGQINRAQANAIRKANAHAKIVMWSVLTGDFDTSKSGGFCFDAVRRHCKPGSIIVFHDSAKAFERLQVALPLTLSWIKDQGWKSVPMV